MNHPMVCYLCSKNVTTYYWVPTPQRGIYAAVCRECKDRVLKEEMKG